MKINFERGGNLKIKSLALILLALFILLFSVNVFAVPNTLTLQGKLTNIAGASLSGTYNMSFKIYDAFTGGNVLWQKDDTNVSTDANGVYDIILQDVNLNFSDEYYLGITVGSDNESKPRVNLTSAPYAFRANVSEDLNPENEYKVSVLNVTGNLSVGADTLFVDGTSGYVGIGTTAPAYKLDVIGDVNASNYYINGSSIFEILDNGTINRSVDLSGYQLDITGNCNGQVVVGINDDGSLNCESDDTGAASGLGMFVVSEDGKHIVLNESVSGSATTINVSDYFINGTSIWDILDNGTINRSLDLSNYYTKSEADTADSSTDTDLLGIVNVTMLDNGTVIRSNVNGSWVIETVNDSIKDYYNHSVDLTGYLISTTEYSNFQLGNVSNYTEYTRSSDFNIENISNTTPWSQVTNAPASSNFQIGNVSNNTLVKGDNVSIALWNVSGGNITPSRADSEDGLNLSVPPLFVDIENDKVGIGDITPSDALEVVGNVRVSGGLNATNLNTTGQTILALSSGNVGIGIASPVRKLDVNGDVAIYGSLNATYINATSGNFTGTVEAGSITSATLRTSNIYESDGSTAWLSVSSCGADTGVSSINADGTITCTADSAHTTDTTTDTDLLGIVNVSMLDNGSVLRTGNLSDIGIYINDTSNSTLFLQISDYSDTTDLGIANVSMLDNGSILRTGNLSDIGVYINDTSNSTLYLLISDYSDTTELGIVNVTMLDNGSVLRTGNLSIIFSERNGSLWNVSGGNLTPSRADSEDGLNMSVPPLFVDIENDRVGIGTTSPSEALDVNGNLNLIIGGYIKFNNANVFRHVTGGVSLEGNSFFGSSSASGDLILKSTSHATKGNIRLVEDGGNVGIGTTAPANKLEVSGNVSLQGNTSIGMNTLFVDNTSSKVGIGTTAPEVEFEVEGSVNISGGLNVTEGDVLLATSGGNVGIGTASPTAKLEVEGNMTVSDTNSTVGNFSVIQYNSSCSGFRFGSTGGLILSCE